MKKTLIISIFLTICTLGYSQETNKDFLKKAETELSTALEKEDYERAAQLKKEIETRKEIEKAVTDGNYELAAQLKKELKNSNIPSTKSEPVHSEFNMSTTVSRSGFYEPEEGNVAIYIVRADKRGGLVGFEYFFNDQYIGKFTGQNYLRLECKPGEQLIWASSENKEFVTAELAANKIYIIQVNHDRWGAAFKVHVSLQPLNKNDSKELKTIVKTINTLDVTAISETEIVSTDAKMKRFIGEELTHYQNITKDKYNFRHLNKNDFIPIEMLK